MTNVGMMDCKKALTETDGDMDKAVEWLREKGLAEGCQEGKPHRCRGYGIRYRLRKVRRRRCRRGQLRDRLLREVRSVRSVRQGYLPRSSCRDNPADVEALKDMQVPGHRSEGRPRSCPRRSWSIGENLQIRRFASLRQEHLRVLCPRGRQDRRPGQPRG